MTDLLPSLPSFLAFLAAGLALNLTPGPDMLYVAARGAAEGKKAGIVSALGIGAGALVHTAAAAVGLAALLSASALAYEVIRWLGAAYLLWIAVQLWKQGELPPLFVIGAKGEAELVNYRVAGRYMIVDRLFGRAELRLGGRKGQQTVRIVSNRRGRA